MRLADVLPARRVTLTAIGAAYEAVRQMMQTPKKASKASDDPEVDDAQRISTTMLSIIAFRGTLELGMELAPQVRAGDGAVARKGPGAARGGRRAGDAAEYGENDKGHHQRDGALRPNGLFDDDRHGSAVGEGGEHLDIRQHEGDRNKEEEPQGGV